MGVAVYDWPKIIDEVVEWLASGKTIRDYSRQEGKPDYSTIYIRLADDEEAGQRIVRARAQGCDAIAEEIVAIADDSSGDVATTADGREVCNGEFVQRSKLRVETRMRLMSKWNSGRYGDKSQVEHSGKVELPTMDDREAATRLAALLLEAKRKQGE